MWGMTHELPLVDRIGLALRAGRRARRWSQRALAEQCSMHPSTIARLETASLDPKLSVVRRPLAMVGLNLDLVADSIWTEDQSLEVDKCGLLDEPDGAGRHTWTRSTTRRGS